MTPLLSFMFKLGYLGLLSTGTSSSIHIDIQTVGKRALVIQLKCILHFISSTNIYAHGLFVIMNLLIRETNFRHFDNVFLCVFHRRMGVQRAVLRSRRGVRGDV